MADTARVTITRAAGPHPDTVALVDTGLADWVSDLPVDEGWVDANAGTPVRWVEGKGWTKDRASMPTSTSR